ncbi:MAG TPA: hypothetical protein ENK06_13480, partial [Gammaproteobacteria bacterium]|nr:hypothetical protein [Gammaproteobacteria bacterium]
KVSGIRDAAENEMLADSWRFTTGSAETIDTEKPVVLQHLPLNDAINIPVTRVVSAAFSKDMDVSTLSSAQFTLRRMPEGELVTGLVSYENRTATFNILENEGLLKSGSQYEVKIENAKDLAGNNIEPYQWTFTTNSLNQAAPEVLSVTFDLLANQSGVKPETRITIQFSETILASPLSAETFKLSNGESGSFKIIDDRTVEFVPSVSLEEQTDYSLTIVAEDILDEDRKALASNFVENFHTGDATAPYVDSALEGYIFPANNSENAAINADVVIKFSEAIAELETESYLSMSYRSSDSDVAVDGTLKVVGNTIQFKPTRFLPRNALINVVANTNITDLAGNALETPYTWSFRTGDTLAPEVVSTEPVENAQRVAVGSNMIVTFRVDDVIQSNEVFDAASITDDSVYVTDADGKKVALDIRVSGNKIILDPINDLAQKTLYKVQIEQSLADVSGQKISSPYSWLFTTEDTTAPTILSFSPEADLMTAQVTQEVTVTFSEEIDSSTLTPSSFYLEDASGTKINATLALDGKGMTARLTPESPLKEEAEYTAYLDGSIKDLAGNLLLPFSWSFVENDFTNPDAVSISPSREETNVAVDRAISIQFSEAMDETTVEDAFSITPAIDGEFLWVGNLLIFTPTSDLLEKETYSVRVAASASDDSGNSLPNDVVWRFTVGDFTPPSIENVSPGAGSFNVSQREPIIVTFSETMDVDSTLSAFSIRPEVQGEISVLDNKLIFAPSEDFLELQDYSVTISGGALDVSENQNPLDLPANWTFTTADFTAPAVLGANPNGGNNAALNTVVSVQFSEDMHSVNTKTAFSITPNIAGDVVVDGAILTFTPLVALTEKTLYTFVIENSATDVNGVALPRYSASFETGDFSAPQISGTTPSASTNNATVDQVVGIVFNEAMDQAATQGAFSITPPIPGDFSWQGNTLSFTPVANLVEQQTYTVTLQTTAADVAGNNLSNPLSFDFTVGDFTRPDIIGMTPQTGASEITLIQPISIAFDEAMNQSVTENAFNISPGIDGQFEWSGNTLTFRAADDFIEQQKYTVTVSASATDLAGNLLQTPYVFDFTTGDFTRPIIVNASPVDGTDNIAVSQPLTFTFSETMNKPSVQAAFKLLPAVDVSYSWDGNVLTITPVTGYVEKETYLVTIDASAVDEANNALISPYNAGFTVGDFTAPTITSVSPEVDATGVAINANISVSFDEPIDPGTVNSTSFIV